MASRNVKVDFYKGLLILGVVFGHTITALCAGYSCSVWLHTFVRTYDMPFFMILSGFFLNKSLNRQDWWRIGLNKIGHILIPIVIWNVLFRVIRIILFGGFTLLGIVRSITGLWFLWAVLLCSLIIVLIYGTIKNKAIRVALFCAITLALHLIPNVPWNLAFMFPFFIIGIYYEKLISLFSEKGVCTLKQISVAVFIICLCFWDSKYNTWNAGSYILKNSTFVIFSCFFRFITGVSGCVTMKWIFDMIYNQKLFSHLKNCLVNFGQNTMPVYILQSFAVEVCLAMVASNIFGHFNGNPLLSFPLLFGYVIAPAVAFAFVYLLNFISVLTKKIPYIGKFLFGCKLL